MAKKKEAAMRARQTALVHRIDMMQFAAVAVSFGGLMLLNKLPHGFSTKAAGMGKKPLDNKRVQLVLAVVVYCLIIANNIKVRLWAIPALALLSLAIAQHKATYGENGDAKLQEVY